MNLKQKSVAKSKSSLRDGEGRLAFFAISPFYFLYLVFGIFPILYTSYMAFFSWDPLGEKAFIGLANFTNLLQDEILWKALRNTLSIWVLGTVPQLALALYLATILNRNRLRFSNFWRAAILIPNVTSVLAIAVIFSSLYGRDFGLINYVLNIFGVDKINWMEGTLTSHIEISSMIIWRWTGYNALIYLAAMQSIPKELYESASLDGASGWQQFIYVTLPGIRNVMIFTITMSTIGGLQTFNEPYILGGVTGGNDKQFYTLAMFLYEEAFRKFQFGYGAAIGIFIFFCVIVFALINATITSKIVKD
ncbi:cellobiose transport system permease protein [Candidatus Planktophila dulcis]|uniref:Cellobiose transport system permease protein n=2 Tax=Candidatus Planktophila dulcis TaxID=1884914 RepID=A0AAD0E543_9ACTN|nr:sugar ABC transporter permease [Candidatus Planktophila dulcis]ASY11643.1 cellobiose transport system permease protein [Candidatus Planktophila dulcis]ASY20898.1 cellobiose transport system permease protein [Candidatus Planktophila dulcis]